MITELSIANFRGIREGKLTGLTQVNILVGRNNTGKSSVLEGLVVLSRTVSSEGADRLGRDMVGHLHHRRVIGRQDERGFYYGWDTKNKFTIGVTLDGFSIETEEFSRSTPHHAIRQEFIEYFRNSVIVDCPTVQDFPVIEKVLWREIMNRRWDREIVQVMNEAYDMKIEDITFFPDTNQMGFKMRERTIPIDVMGEGVKHAIVLLSVAVGSKDSALLIEEPEAHQHPEALLLMLVALFKMAKRNRLQLFMSTHSLELITAAIQAAEKEELDVKLFHLSLSSDGVLTARGISAPDAKVLADVGSDPRMLHKYVSP